MCLPRKDQPSPSERQFERDPAARWARGGVMTVVFVDRRAGRGSRAPMRLGRPKRRPPSTASRAPWPTAPARQPLDEAWPDWKVGPRRPAVCCGVVDLYTARMVRTGALPPRPGAGPPPPRPGAVARPVVKIGRGTLRHETAKRPGPRPTYRRLRVGGPLVPRYTRRRGWRPAWFGSVFAQDGWRGASPEALVATLTLVIVLLSTVSASFA